MARAKKTTEVTAEQKTESNSVLAAHSIEDLMETYKTKSATIRFLASEGHKRADIARALGIRYQHVRNVLVQDAEKEAAQGDTKKS